ncbi:MAG: hypothetical protein LAP86_17820 [Acidobacteriia bacterium]|nr:hypothetical protein [Terriglobia bacterium]
MLIIGCDYHPGLQQIAFVDKETGECGERRLAHREEAEQFYRELKAGGLSVRVGMESSGHARWFERLLRELEFELWIGDAAEIRTGRSIPVRNKSASLRASILSLLLPSFNKALRRGSQTSTCAAWGFSRS